MDKIMAQNDFMLSMRDLADFLKCSPQAVHKGLREKGLETHIIGNKLYIPPNAVREFLLSKNYVYPKKIISVQMLKGGTGKTTTAANVAIRANMYGAKVLIIDLDQQANLSFAFGFENEEAPVWIDILEGTMLIQDAIVHLNPSLHLIPSNLNNSLLDKVLSDGKKNIARGISQYLDQIQDEYDLIIIDTGPNIGATNVAACIAASNIILPVNPDKFSLIGLRKTISELGQIAGNFNKNITTKVLFTRFDGREGASHEFLKKCYAYYGDNMMKSFVRTSSEIKKKINTQDTIYDKKSTAKDDYDVVTKEILGF